MLKEEKKTVRPFLETSKVTPRSCSTPLQRRIVDFGADAPFHDVPKKLFEHYGFEISPEVARQITLGHAKKIDSYLKEEENSADLRETQQLISEIDGGMVPIVMIDDNPEIQDRRKTRKVCWKESRLCFSRDINKINGVFRATMGSTEDAGDIWFSSAVLAGLGNSTKVHCIGDGATWIKDQADRIFANQGAYLIDFYHLSDYLAAASKERENGDHWFHEQQKYLKKGKVYKVLQELEQHLHQQESLNKEATQACYRYMTNRLDQLDYLGAIENGLPIGSGEIESAHRHVVQKRMKRAGAWWRIENAELILQLLCLRSNMKWEAYWDFVSSDFFGEAA